MADFDRAFLKTMQHEGGYIDHPMDPGGETYMGIARTRHPKWEGWACIDAYKKSPEFPRVMDSDNALKGRVRDFYNKRYWTPIAGAVYRSQEVGEQVFDTAINMGIHRAVTFLQIALNILNREEKLYPNIAVDGQMGPITEHTLEQYQEWEPPAYLIKLLIIQRGAFYIDIARRREQSEVFLRGWLRRIGIR